MTKALTIIPPVPAMRIVDTIIGKAIPAVDIADNIGYRRSAISNTIKNNESFFKGFTVYETLPTAGGMQSFLCLNSVGTDRLFLLIKPAKDRELIFGRVEAFKAKAFGRLAEPQKNIAKIPEPNINEELHKAKEYAEITNADVRAFQAAVFKKHGMPEFADIVRPPIEHGETGWYNVTQLIDFCNDPQLVGHPEHLNSLLYNKGFQYKEGILWRLNPSGEAHGKEYTFEAVTGHREVRIRWRKSILVASGLIRDEGQAALPEKAE